MSRNRSYWLAIACLIVGLAALAHAFVSSQLGPTFSEFLEQSGKLGPITLLLGYILLCAFILPVWPLTVAAGAAYGVAKGTVIVWIGTLLGAVVGFGVSRKWARKKIWDLVQQKELIEALDQAITQEGWKIVFLSRLSPLLPFSLVSHLFGLTHINLATYITATAAGVLIPDLIYVYSGYLVRLGLSKSPFWSAQSLFHLIGLLATIATTLLTIKVSSKVLRERGLNLLINQRTGQSD